VAEGRAATPFAPVRLQVEMVKCCGNCRLWLEGVTPSDGFGWCGREVFEKVPDKDLGQIINGKWTRGPAGLETEASGVCDGHRPIPVRYCKK
jgi:hypothetical protein